MDYTIATTGTVIRALMTLEGVISFYFERKGLQRDSAERLSEAVTVLKYASKRFKEYWEAQAAQNNASELEEMRKWENEFTQLLLVLYPSVQHAHAHEVGLQQSLEQADKTFQQFSGVLTQFTNNYLRKSLNSDTSDHYVSAVAVPINPPRLTLHFNSLETPEGKLKAAILKHSEQHVASIAAVGQGGVGKTCALRGLAHDLDVLHKFPDGILFIALGKDANMRHIVREIAHIVDATGGGRCNREIRDRQLDQAVKSASIWFEARKCLFLVDDIWYDAGTDVLGVLSTMLTANSRLVYSTRDLRLQESANVVVPFFPRLPRGDESRAILMNHAGLPASTHFEGENRGAVEGILDICQGVPLMLSLSGASIRQRGLGPREWHTFFRELSTSGTIVTKSVPGYGQVSEITERSIDVLKLHYSGTKAKGFSTYVDEIYRSLCVLEKNQTVPISVLRRVWDPSLANSGKAEKVIEEMRNVGIIELKEVKSGTWSTKAVRPCSGVLNIVQYETKRENVYQGCCKRLIDSYIVKETQASLLRDSEGGENNNMLRMLWPKRSHLQPIADSIGMLKKLAKRIIRYPFRRNNKSNSTDSTSCKTTLATEKEHPLWWTVEDEDGYINDNICRLLKEAGEVEELSWLLMKPQWTMNRLRRKGAEHILQDVLKGMSALTALTDRDEQRELKECLDTIAKAVAMSGAAVGRNTEETWFQLYGRLLLHAQHSTKVKKYIEEIESNVVKLWAKPGLGFLIPAGGDKLETMCSDVHILCATVSYDRILMCCRGILQLSLLRYDLQHGTVERTYLGSENVPKPWNKETTCAAIVPDDETIVTGFRDGAVAVWSGTSGTLLFESSSQHSDEVRCVAISGDKQYIVSGSLDSTIHIWNRFAESEYQLRQTLRGHTESVLCVSLSGDGTRVVSGSEDKTVRVWDCNSGMPIAKLEGHYDRVSCVAYSQDGTRIVSGSYDNTVRVWFVEDFGDLPGGAINKVLAGHTGTVQSVAVSGDGTRIVSGSEDDTVRVWNVENAESMANDYSLSGHKDWIVGVAFSRDGGRIVSWSLDRTVRLWNGENGSAVSTTTADHTDKTTCVAASVDGRRVFSGSEDGSIRVWDGKSGNLIGDALIGHKKRIRCIAVSSYGRFLASGSDDMTVRVWDTKKGNAVKVFDGFKHGVKRVGIRCDSERLVSIGGNGEGCLWDLKSGERILMSAELNWDEIIQELKPDWSDHSELPRVKSIVEESKHGDVILGTPDSEVWYCRDRYYSFRCDSLAVCEVLHPGVARLKLEL